MRKNMRRDAIIVSVAAVIRYGVTGQPETFFITADGKVVNHLLGPLTESQMFSNAKAAGLH